MQTNSAVDQSDSSRRPSKMAENGLTWNAEAILKVDIGKSLSFEDNISLNLSNIFTWQEVFGMIREIQDAVDHNTKPQKWPRPHILESGLKRGNQNIKSRHRAGNQVCLAGRKQYRH